MTARRAEQTRRLANHTHTKTLHKPPAAQRLAISRARRTEAHTLDQERLDMPPVRKIAPTEGVGCMAVFGGILVTELYSRE